MPTTEPSPGPTAPRTARPGPARTRRRVRTGGAAPLWTLMYHSVDDPSHDPYRITVSPERLDRQLRWLGRRGLRGVAMAELLRAERAGRSAGLVGLTFDDGYADFLGEAVPLLRRHGCTATVFAVAGRLGGTNDWDPLGPRKPLLTAAGLREAAAAGMEIGSHGLLHRSLTRLGADLAWSELQESRRLLAEVTGHPPAGFCYPYGDVDAATAALARQAGYAYACAIDPGPLTGPHALPRAHVDQRDTGWRLHLKRLLHPVRRRPVPALTGPRAAEPRG